MEKKREVDSELAYNEAGRTEAIIGALFLGADTDCYNQTYEVDESGNTTTKTAYIRSQAGIVFKIRQKEFEYPDKTSALEITVTSTDTLYLPEVLPPNTKEAYLKIKLDGSPKFCYRTAGVDDCGDPILIPHAKIDADALKMVQWHNTQLTGAKLMSDAEVEVHKQVIEFAEITDRISDTKRKLRLRGLLGNLFGKQKND